MPMNPRLLRPSTKASAPTPPRITTESGAALKTESGDKIRTEQD
jgi:hypothetical protein